MLKQESHRFQSYQDYIIQSGGNEKLFELPFIQQIIFDIIHNGDPILLSLNKSTLYYKDANPDGTFDICGRMDGPTVNLVYSMSYCNDYVDNHFLKLRRFEEESHYEDSIMVKDGITQKDIFLDHDGNVIEEIDLPMINYDDIPKSLLAFTKEKVYSK